LHQYKFLLLLLLVHLLLPFYYQLTDKYTVNTFTQCLNVVAAYQILLMAIVLLVLCQTHVTWNQLLHNAIIYQ